MNHATFPSTDADPKTPFATGTLFTFQEFEGVIIDGQFYVRDTALGEKLGYGRDRKIRDLIDRHREELSTYGPMPQLGAMVEIGSGAERNVKANYLSEDHALVLIGHSSATNAQLIKREIIAVYKAFVRGGLELTAEQGLDRLAAEETSLAAASEGAEIQLRKAAALEDEARRIREAALAVRAARNDRFALMSASSQILASKEPLPANQTMFGRQLMKLYSDAAAMGTTRRRASE